MAIENKALTARQFHFLRSLTTVKSRTGGGVLDFIEQKIGELTKNQFHAIARSLIKRKLVTKTTREHSQLVDYVITDAGREVLASYLLGEADEKRQTLSLV